MSNGKFNERHLCTQILPNVIMQYMCVCVREDFEWCLSVLSHVPDDVRSSIMITAYLMLVRMRRTKKAMPTATMTSAIAMLDIHAASPHPTSSCMVDI